MADSDRFSIAFFGSTGYQEVTAADPLVFGDFSAALVPEPSALLLGLFGMAGIGLLLGRTGR